MKLNSATQLFWQNIAVLSMYALLVYVLLFLTGTFFSGYHLSDDQILIKFNSGLHERSFFSSEWFQIKDDLFRRFRPLAIFYYQALAKWPYPNFSIIALLVSLQSIFTCYFFYRFARYLKCSPVLSFLFPLFILCGNQGVIFWRNCVNETLAMCLLSVSFFYLGKIFNSRDHSPRLIFLFSFFLTLSTLTKESFIILVPAILFYKIWQQGLFSKKGFWFSLKQDIGLVTFFTFLVLTELAIIYYYKNHSNRFIEYVGVDKDSFKLSNLFISLFRLWVTKSYLIIIVPAIIFILFSKNKFTLKREIRSFFIPLAIFFLLVTIPQVLLYSKSLIFERYLLPGTLGAAMLILFIREYISRNPSSLKFLNKTFLPACAIILLIQTFLMIKGAIAYANDGYETNDMLSTIMQNTNPNDNILIVAKPQGQSEQSISTKMFLNANIGGRRNNVFMEPVIDSTLELSHISQSDVDNFKQMTNGIRYANIPDKKNISCVAFFPNIKDSFLFHHPEFDTMHYTQINAGKFSILVKKQKQ